MENPSGLQSRRPNNDHLGVNKIGKSIRKSPLHQPTFPNPPTLPGAGAGARPTQPQVYNISKTDFRSIVQQLTGSPALPPAGPPPVTVPALAPAPPPPAANSPKAASLRLQRIRPPPLSPIARPPIPLLPNPNPPPPAVAAAAGGGEMWTNAGESSISAYMRYLQNTIAETGQSRPAAPPPSYGLLPTPPLASPTAQFGVPSPSSFLNLLSPRSPYPLLSPGFQFPPPLTPNFAFSAQSPGILGPAPFAPPSPGLLFPPSPSGLFPSLSPRWRE